MDYYEKPDKGSLVIYCIASIGTVAGLWFCSSSMISTFGEIWRYVCYAVFIGLIIYAPIAFGMEIRRKDDK